MGFCPIGTMFQSAGVTAWWGLGGGADDAELDVHGMKASTQRLCRGTYLQGACDHLQSHSHVVYADTCTRTTIVSHGAA